MFTPWMLLVDVGLVSILLLLGKLLRANVRFIQKLFIPPSLLAGLAALLLGPEVLGWLPLSDNMGTYASILIALVFSTLPLTSRRHEAEGEKGSIGRMWAYSQSGMLLQWALGGILGFLVFSLWYKADPALGLSMPASVVIGMWLISWGAGHGKASFLSRYSDLPGELRTGILPKDKRSSMGQASFSAISLDSMTFNFAIIALIAAGGYGISKLVSHFWPSLMLPVFSCAFLVGLMVRWVLNRARFDEYVSKPIVGHLGGAFTDYLVAFGVASIKLEIVARFVVPLLVLLAAGLCLTLFFVFFVGARIHKDYWFEKTIFTWGWFTGTMAMGMALLRITDPESKSRCLDDYAFAYLYIAPVEIALVTFSPMAFASGYGWYFVGFCLVSGLAVLTFSGLKGWLKR